MTLHDFEKLSNDLLNSAHDLMCGDKNTEYSKWDDKLYNFRRAGQIALIEPEVALWGMALKHLVSIQDQVEQVEEGAPTLPMPKIREKIIDLINYLVMLYALLRERSGYERVSEMRD